MHLRFLAHAIVAATLFAFAAPSAASGSDAAGGGYVRDAQYYNIGKGVYAQKVACNGCPMAGKTLDSATARELAAGKGTPALSTEEQQALTVYLERRFKF